MNNDKNRPAPPTGLEREGINRRSFIGAGSGALLAAAGVTGPQAAGQDIAAATQARKDGSASDPGPENRPIREANPNTFLPPPTDHGEVQTFWNTFSSAHRRIQEGGWSRQVTVADFPISKEIAGVNMRLTAGGVRELHWHEAAEWGIILTGSARLTAIDAEGKAYVKDVSRNDLWFFPPGIPHSIQGLEPDGCEFLLVFDDGSFSEGNTTLLSDWLRHTPPEILAKNWGVAGGELKGVYNVPTEGHYIFQTTPPARLDQDQRAAAGGGGLSSVAFDFSMSSMAPTYKTASGEARVIDSRNFLIATTIAAAHIILKPGGLRELHWHPNADEWQYYLQGTGRMTVFFTGGKARTADFNAGDVGYVPKTFGHYIENTGDSDLVFLEMFKANRFRDLSLSQWVAHTPPALVMAHLNISEETLKKIPREKPRLFRGKSSPSIPKPMKSKLLHEAPERMFALVFDEGDEVESNILNFARKEKLLASQFSGIGAFSSVVLGFFDFEIKDYQRIPLEEQVEVLSLLGNIARAGDEQKIHAHVVVGSRDGTARGGHLLEARVRPTLELIVTESPAHLQRAIDEKTGLPLLKI